MHICFQAVANLVNLIFQASNENMTSWKKDTYRIAYSLLNCASCTGSLLRWLYDR